MDIQEKMLSACAGALVTSVLFTPLDVVKVRMQAQTPATASQVRAGTLASAAACEFCPVFTFDNGIMQLTEAKEGCRNFQRCRSTGTWTINPELSLPRSVANRGTLETAVHIVRREGVGALYHGLLPTLLMSVPATVLYFTLYEELKGRLAACGEAVGLPQSEALWAPICAGAGARVMAAATVAPLELVRTQAQSVERAGASMVDLLVSNVRQRGWQHLYRGLGPTLWRDVPFSAMYWVGYERLKLAALEAVTDSPTATAASTTTRRRGTGAGAGAAGGIGQDNSLTYAETMTISFAAGGGSGAFAAFVTNPFDVVKTRRQVEQYFPSTAAASSSSASTSSTSSAVRRGFATTAATSPPSPSTFSLLQRIASTEGVGALFNGVVPRMLKVAPACAVMISSYEVGKMFFGKYHEGETN
eukprot:g2839.t1